MKYQNLCTLLLFLTVVFSVIPGVLHAEDSDFASCPSGESARDFVRQSIVLCMQDLPSRRSDCMNHAEAQFYQCKLNGNFRKISSKVQTRIIFLSFFKNLVAPQNVRYGLITPQNLPQ